MAPAAARAGLPTGSFELIVKGIVSSYSDLHNKSNDGFNREMHEEREEKPRIFNTFQPCSS
jgi:hypothetical protein